MVDGLAIMYATVLSIQLPGDPIWMFIVGPPGCGKTLLLNSFRNSPWAVYRSSITPKSLISGYVTSDGVDPSLIPRLRGKCFMLKDYTEIVSMPREAQDEIYGIFRGAFDGHCEKTFGNGLYRCYPDCYFSMLACVTEVIHGDDRAALGERFLKYNLVQGTTLDPTKHIESAITGMATQVETESKLQGVSAAFTNRDMEQESIPSPEPWFIQRVIALSRCIGHLRATVARTGRDELIYRPTPEVGTRLAKQLVKLAQCLAVVLGKKRIDMDCYRLIYQVAIDTATGWNLDIFLFLMDNFPRPVLKEEIEIAARIASTTCTPPAR